MRKDYEKLFANISPIEPPDGLFEKIMSRIARERGFLTLKRRLVIFAFGIAGSAAAFIPIFKMAQAGFVESGFIQFFSLLFSDAETVIVYWRNFGLALLETLPVTSVALLLAAVLVFLESLKLFIKDGKIFLRQHN